MACLWVALMGGRWAEAMVCMRVDNWAANSAGWSIDCSGEKWVVKPAELKVALTVECWDELMESGMVENLDLLLVAMLVVMWAALTGGGWGGSTAATKAESLD